MITDEKLRKRCYESWYMRDMLASRPMRSETYATVGLRYVNNMSDDLAYMPTTDVRWVPIYEEWECRLCGKINSKYAEKCDCIIEYEKKARTTSSRQE